MKSLIERFGIQKIILAVILIIVIVLLSVRYDRGVRVFSLKSHYDAENNVWGGSRRGNSVNLYDVKLYYNIEVESGGADVRISILDKNDKEVKCVYEESFDGEQKVTRTIDIGDLKPCYSIKVEESSRNGEFDTNIDYQYKKTGLAYVLTRWFGY